MEKFLMSIMKDGEVMGYIGNNVDGKIITEGSIGENVYDTRMDLIKGLQGHGIHVDNFYW